MALKNWLNPKRLRDYPRLILIACSIVLLLNLLLHRGWVGGVLNLLMWGDFVVYYAGGLLYKTDIAQLYNPVVQESTQLSLIAPTVPPGVTLYSYPPHAALLHSVLSYLSLPISLILWCLLSIYCIILAAQLMQRYLVPKRFSQNGLTTPQLAILIFSSFAFIEGFAAGQMHAITLLIMVGILVATLKEKWFIAGLLAAGLTYKPQFVVGFLLVWLVWKKFYPILVFILFSIIWNGFVLITKGVGPYLAYLDFLKNMVYLPYVKEGFPTAVLATPYSLVASLIPFKYSTLWNQVYYGLVAILLAFFVWLIFTTRKQPLTNQNLVLSMAMLFPLIITPYALLHDLLLLIPVLILLAYNPSQDRRLLYITIGVYIAMLFLPALGIPLKVALTGLIPVFVFIVWARQSVVLLRA
ncbi:MAG: hypothetical protein C3F13_05250 [Anaerolineales bacterium]|nr:DUF2029 domain-containing protein [Anaerolineae bacterium]PWB55128.1 MAG: hypothetical protein C3F13_05250 [Anaerolineales bacterium]